MAASDHLGADLGSGLLLTDLYQLNMLQAYRDAGMTATAVFEFFVRRLPPTRGFLVAAGLEQMVEFLESARFSEADLDWLARAGRFSSALLDDLARWRFTGDVHAMPKGTVFLPGRVDPSGERAAAARAAGRDQGHQSVAAEAVAEVRLQARLGAPSGARCRKRA